MSFLPRDIFGDISKIVFYAFLSGIIAAAFVGVIVYLVA